MLRWYFHDRLVQHKIPLKIPQLDEVHLVVQTFITNYSSKVYLTNY